MSNNAQILVVGAGHASGQLVTSLRSEGHQGQITLIGEEPFPPYQRPPLSKKFLAGELDEERLLFRPASFYADHDITLRLGERVVELDRSAKSVALASGESVAYDRLALTTGTRVRKVPIDGADLNGVFYLRTIEDVNHIRTHLESAERLVIIGGGFIGLEVAAVARQLGKQVTVLEMQDRLMPRVVAPLVSDFYAEVHSSRGTSIITGTQVEQIVGTANVEAVRCTDGSEYPCDLVIVGIGVVPNSELAEAAGLDCDNGIVVDEYARTSDPDIVAAGDVCNHPNATLGRRLRLESVHNAVEQAKTAAASLCDVQKPYNQVPWFWSDQYEFKLQMVGLSTGYDQLVVRGDLASQKFSVFYFAGDKFIAVDSISKPADHMISRKLLALESPLTPEQAADVDFDLKTLTSKP